MKLSQCFLGGPRKGRINITITAEHARQRGQQESGRAGRGLAIQQEMMKRKSEGCDGRIEKGGEGGEHMSSKMGKHPSTHAFLKRDFHIQ